MSKPVFPEDIKPLDYEKLDLIERENPAYEPVMFQVLEDAINSKRSNSIAKGEVRDWLNSLLD